MAEKNRLKRQLEDGEIEESIDPQSLKILKYGEIDDHTESSASKMLKGIEDYVEPIVLMMLKLQLKGILDLPRPLTRKQNLVIESLEFKISVCHAVTKLFHTGLKDLQCHCVKANSPAFQVTEYKFQTDWVNSVPEEGSTRVITGSNTTSIWFECNRIGVRIPQKDPNYDEALTMLISALRHFFTPKRTSTSGETVKFVRSEFNLNVENVFGAESVVVVFWFISIDPKRQKMEYEILMDKALSFSEALKPKTSQL